MKKRMFSILLVFAMILMMAVPAFAEGDVAQIGETKYPTLAAAVAAAKEGDTVTLLQDASGCGIITGNGDVKNFTIDFGGHTYTVNQEPLAGSSGTETQCFQLLKETGSLTMKNGTIVADHSDAWMIIQNYCDLTLVDMTLDATRGTNSVDYVLSNNHGDVTITGNTIITPKAGDGNVAFDVCDFADYGKCSVTFDENFTGSINGKMEYTGTDPENYKLVIKNGNFVEFQVPDNFKSAAADGGITVSGGKFEYEFPAEYLADGYVLVQDANGKFVPVDKAVEYKITYVLGDHAKNVDSNPATYTVEDEVSLEDAVADYDYIFKGWYYDEKFANPVNDPAISKGNTGDITFYAKVDAVVYKVTYENVEGAENKNPASYSAEASFKLQDPVKKGYKFEGWYFDKDLKDEIKGDDLTVSTENYYGNLVFYAKWSKVETKTPETGDNSGIAAVTILLISAVGAAAALTLRRRVDR